jgi:hypothetical protein
VVGVVGNIRSLGLARQLPYEFYRTTEQSPFGEMSVVVRSAGADPTALVPAARRIVQDLDPSLPVTGVQTMEEVVAESVGRQRFLSALTGVFAGLAAVLAMVGVTLYFAGNIGAHLSQTLRVIMVRVMGMILLAIAVEMLVGGLAKLLPGLAPAT